MAIVEKTNRKGVDKAIHVLQQRTYANLLGFWADGVEYTMYPRANKNFKNDSTIPEISLDSKNYKETFYDDKVAVNSFFLVDDQSTYQNDNNQIVQDVSIIFQADLVKLYGDAERVDEVFNSDVLQVFKDVKRFIYSDIERITGFDSVYSDLSLSADLREKIQFSDISNRHILRLDFSIRYDFKCDSPIVPLCVPVTIMENGVLVARQAAGTTYSYSTACSDGNVTVNGSEFGIVASGGTLDVPVQYENGTEVGINVDGVIEIPNPITCADATVNLNGVFNQTVESGGTANVIVGNSEITVNGESFESLAPEESLDVEVEYETSLDNPIQSIVGNKILIVDPVVCPSDLIYQEARYTGQVVSYADGDSTWRRDNDKLLAVVQPEKGIAQRLQNGSNYLLLYDNVFGNKYMVTGLTGGYYNPLDGNYYDVTNSIVTRADAFPDEIGVDHLYNRLVQTLQDGTKKTWYNWLADGLTLTMAGFTEWYLPTINEGVAYADWSITLPFQNSLPFEWGSQAKFLSDTYLGSGTTSCYTMESYGQIRSIAKTNSYKAIYIKPIDINSTFG